MDGNGKPRRQSAEVLNNVEIKRMLEEIVAQIGDWQHETAYLQARAARATGSARAQIATQATGLLGQIGATRDSLGARLAGAPERIARHSRVEDVHKALGSLAQSLQQIVGVAAE